MKKTGSKPAVSPFTEGGGDNRRRSHRNIAGPSRRTELIGDDLQFVTLTGQSKDRPDEIISACRIDPTGTENDVSVCHLANGCFARELTAPIGVDWRRHI